MPLPVSPAVARLFRGRNTSNRLKRQSTLTDVSRLPLNNACVTLGGSGEVTPTIAPKDFIKGAIYLVGIPGKSFGVLVRHLGLQVLAVHVMGTPGPASIS